MATDSFQGPSGAASVPTDPLHVANQLFRHQSPRYLLALFCLPRERRRPGLIEAADWFGLDAALVRANPTADVRVDIEERWLKLLDACVLLLEREGESRDARVLRGLITALSAQAARGDGHRSGPPDMEGLGGLWKELSRALETRPGRPSSRGARGTDPDTLRGRRWAHLRTSLSRLLAGMATLATPKSLLPRKPRSPLLFGEAHFEAIDQALRRGSLGSGIAVVVAPPGAGRAELALGFAWDRLNTDYDRVFALRATDPIRLEQDFIMMAEALTGVRRDRATMRREAFKVLEQHGRWLIVFLSVHDPAILQPFLPWNSDGHILCTYWDAKHGETGLAGELDEVDEDDPWLKYLNVGFPQRLGHLTEFRPVDMARTLLGDVVPEPLHGGLRTRLAGSALAMTLARSWFELTAESADVSTRVEAYLRTWDELSAWKAEQEAASQDAPPNPQRSDGAETRREYAKGVVAALILLCELAERTPELDGLQWRDATQIADPRLEHEALKLLARLEPFTDASGMFSTFPAALLDPSENDAWEQIDDPRLLRLSELALAERATGVEAQNKYFDVHAAILDAVRRMRDRLAIETDSVAACSATMLTVLGGRPRAGRSSELTFELLPHADALARREEQPHKDSAGWRPFVAIELYARGVAGHLARGRIRSANVELSRMRAVFGRIGSAQPAALLDDWPATVPVVPLLKRMARVVRDLRTAGYPRTALEEVFEPLLMVLKRNPDIEAHDVAGDIARLWFEAAMAYHDRDQIDSAQDLLGKAKDIWVRAGDQRREMMAVGFEAELQIDLGDFALARIKAQEAMATRQALLDAASAVERPAMLSEVARSAFLLGRIAYVQGRLQDSERHFGESVAHWEGAIAGANALDAAGNDAPVFDLINLLTASAYHAMLKALLGDAEEARALAESVRVRWSDTRELKRHGEVGIQSNLAQVLRLTGRVDEAASGHQRALASAETTWEDDGHRALMVLRRKCAESLLDAGRPAEAFREIEKLIGPLPADAPVGAVLAAARVWSTLGQVLVDTSLGTRPEDTTRLRIAATALDYGRTLFERGAQPGELHNPGLVDCLASQSEVALRNEQGATAVELAEEALELAGKIHPESSPRLLAPRARLIRAQAVSLAGDAAAIARLGDAAQELAILGNARLAIPRERVEIALARAEVLAAQMPAVKLDDVLRLSREWFDEALEPLYDVIGNEPHQLVARTYFQLASVADRGGSAQKRARNQREGNRLQPPFKPNDDKLLMSIGAAIPAAERAA